jgi:hypothetical protein
MKLGFLTNKGIAHGFFLCLSHFCINWLLKKKKEKKNFGTRGVVSQNLRVTVGQNSALCLIKKKQGNNATCINCIIDDDILRKNIFHLVLDKGNTYFNKWSK